MHEPNGKAQASRLNARSGTGACEAEEDLYNYVYCSIGTYIRSIGDTRVYRLRYKGKPAFV